LSFRWLSEGDFLNIAVKEMQNLTDKKDLAKLLLD